MASSSPNLRAAHSGPKVLDALVPLRTPGALTTIQPRRGSSRPSPGVRAARGSAVRSAPCASHAAAYSPRPRNPPRGRAEARQSALLDRADRRVLHVRDATPPDGTPSSSNCPQLRLQRP